MRRVRAPRRLLLTFLAFLLGGVWIGQAILGMMFRPAADPARLNAWIPLGLMSYGLWHVLKTTCRKPVEPFEWTATETELLGAAPLPREQLVGYRLVSIVLAAIVKALLFSIVMLPDLPNWAFGFLGMLLALVFLDLLRMMIEVATWGCSPRTLRWARTAVVSIAATCLVSALVIAKSSVATTSTILPALNLLIRFFSSVMSLKDSLPGQVLLVPFQTFGNVVMANGSFLETVSQLLITIVTVASAAWLMIRADLDFQRRRQAREESIFPTLLASAAAKKTTIAAASKSAVRVPRARFGAGTICWRQLLGMVHYGPSILFSMLMPGFLSLIPLFGKSVPFSTALQITGGLVFYSFLLMPSALRFDFRRDVDRMAVLKALPISPAAMTFGQLAAPVLACTLFQTIVLSIAMIVEPYSVSTFLLCIGLLVPINFVIFGLENLIFMYFPYRPNQEGIAVFIRSILTFTAKGILFCCALVTMMAWIRISIWLARHWGIEPSNQGHLPLSVLVILWSGIWCSLCAIGATLFVMISRVYAKFDPSQDAPAMS